MSDEHACQREPHPPPMDTVYAWDRWFASLPPETQAIIDDAARRDREYGEDFAREAADG